MVLLTRVWQTGCGEAAASGNVPAEVVAAESTGASEAESGPRWSE
ncbi:hypothetical protein [Streptomyces albus]|nr:MULTISPECIES: hypothetical protein [unclassified Streptomyces]